MIALHGSSNFSHLYINKLYAFVHQAHLTQSRLIPRYKLCGEPRTVKFTVWLSHHGAVCNWGDFNSALHIFGGLLFQEMGAVLCWYNSNLYSNSMMRFSGPFFTYVDTESYRGEKMRGQMSHGKSREELYIQVFDDNVYVLSTCPRSLSISTEITMIKTVTTSLLSCTVKCLRKDLLLSPSSPAVWFLSLLRVELCPCIICMLKA